MVTPVAGNAGGRPPSKAPGRRRLILLVDADAETRNLVSLVLRNEGFEVDAAADGREALARLGEVRPDLVLSDVTLPEMDGFELLRRIRGDSRTVGVPVILLSSLDDVESTVKGLRLGADDYVPKPFHVAELLARVQSKVDRPPVPAEQLVRDLRTGLFTETRFLQETGREISRAARVHRPGAVAVMELAEMERLRSEFGQKQDEDIVQQVLGLHALDAFPLEMVGRDRDGHFLFLLSECARESAATRLQWLSRRVASHPFVAGGESLRLTPVVGFATYSGDESPEALLTQARAAAWEAGRYLDLRPVAYRDGMDAEAADHRQRQAELRRRRERRGLLGGLRLGFQILVTFVLALVAPYLFYRAVYRAGMDVSTLVYVCVVASLVGTCLLIWAEGIAALRRVEPPEEPASPFPPASALIAAYLPNEAATIEETVNAFLRLDYPGPLQIILAYNTPRNLPVEDALREIAARDGRLVLLRVPASESKAQNVNAGLLQVTGEFVGIFDADHHPDPGSFRRAWRWISRGYDVVQGHCLVRNGDSSWVSRMVAVEFEAIYAVSHPGRTRLHAFGIFGGSNGYWSTGALRETRMHGFMLTEDIDSSLRILSTGGKIACDPLLVSRELAPSTLKALWNQRMRWAQGWFQVSLAHFFGSLASGKLSLRNKLGLFYLLVWREIFPWIALQVFPIIAFWAYRDGGLDRVDWFVPIFVVTTLFTLATGPGQVFFTWKLADPEVKRRTSWFVGYVAKSVLFYAEFKNLISRVAQVKEVMRERDWRVTPRGPGRDSKQG